MSELENQLRADLLKIGLNENFKLSLRPYSKSYYGRYIPRSNTVIVYVNKSPNGEPYPYIDLLLVVIHEVIHCMQWSRPNFKRIKGVMHNPEFKQLYGIYSNRAKALVLFREVIKNYDIIDKKRGRKVYNKPNRCGA